MKLLYISCLLLKTEVHAQQFDQYKTVAQALDQQATCPLLKHCKTAETHPT